MRSPVPALAILLAGCAAAGDWSKAGSDAAATATAYDDCRAAAMAVIGPQAGIDQDIAATRASDIQRSGVMRRDAQNIVQETGDRAARLVAACMQGKGFTRAPPPTR